MKQLELVPKPSAPTGSPFLAVDATPAHNAVVGQWTAAARRPDGPPCERLQDPCTEQWRIEVVAPYQETVQLYLPGYTLGVEKLIHAIRHTMSWEGLRHWAAWLTLLSLKGGRADRVRWTVREHLDLMGYRKQAPKTRGRAIRMMQHFTWLRIRVIKRTTEADKPDKDDWIERATNLPLVISLAHTEKRRARSPWEVDGMILQINPLLYSGVRHPDTHKVGRLWWPQTPTIAQIDHRRFRYAIALGLLLPMRWRWARDEGKDYAAATGANLLRAAGIRYTEHDKGKAWDILGRNLAKLQEHGALGKVVLDGPPHVQTVFRLYPTPEQTAIFDGKGRQLERRPVDLPTTGSDLRKWRESQGLTQAALGAALGVRRETVNRAERAGDRPLSRRLARAVRGVTFSALTCGRL